MERRAGSRKTVLMSGTIEFAGSNINCLISDISISEAALEVTRHASLSRVEFALRSAGEARHVLDVARDGGGFLRPS